MAIIGPSDWAIQEIRDRGITRLCHFASIRALERMLDDRAIIDRQTLETRNQGCAFNDLQRLDGHRGHVCVSVEHPNVWMMDQLSSKAPQAREFVVVCIKPAEIARDNVLFCSVNAATNFGEFLAAGQTGFTRLFDSITGSRAPARKLTHARSCPTDLQAEVLIPGPIPLSSALCVVTTKEEIASYIRLILKARALALQVVVQPRLFSKSEVVAAVWGGKVIELPGM